MNRTIATAMVLLVVGWGMPASLAVPPNPLPPGEANVANDTSTGSPAAKEAVANRGAEGPRELRAGHPTRPPSGQPTPRGERQGGDTCFDAVDISGPLPISIAGTTVGYNNDYDEACPFEGSTAPDVVYAYTPMVDTDADFTLCLGMTNYDTKMYIYEGVCPNPGFPLACNDDACVSAAGQEYVSELLDVPLMAGQTYYIVIDGWGDQSGDYFLDITSFMEPPLTCPEDGSTLFGQTPALEDGWAGVSEMAPWLRRYDNFSGVASEITGLRFWGLQVLSDGWTPCFEDPLQFEITFYDDAGGIPGAPLCGPYDLWVSGMVVANVEGKDVYEFDAGLPAPCFIENGWVSIVGAGDPNCWFMWLGSNDGDGQSLGHDGMTWMSEPHDLSVCLIGTSGQDIGGCCMGGGCTDGVPAGECEGMGGVFGGPGSVCPFDQTDPTLAVPPDIVIGHDEPLDPDHTGWATVDDDFDPNPELWYEDLVEGLEGCNGGTVYRTWFAMDACGNFSDGTHTITVEEDTCDDGFANTYDFCNPYSAVCENLRWEEDLYEPFVDGVTTNGGLFTDAVLCTVADTGTKTSDPINLFSGDVVEAVTDLQIPGRGFEFALRRTYRSRTGRLTWMGHNWSMSYDVHLHDTGSALLLCNGGGRLDVFPPQGPGVWGRPEYSRQIVQDGAQFRMHHADRTTWTFSALPGAPPGVFRLTSIEDRNANQMTLEYDPQGRLAQIHDTLDIPGVNDRVITFAYNADGFLETVTDWTGREVRYEYYQDGDAGGSFGDLRSVIYPAIAATPDYPVPAEHERAGAIWTYTYTTGFTDAELNHDLLTITSGRANDPADPLFGAGPYLQNIYAHTIDPADPRYTTNPANPNYGRVVAQFYGPGRYDYVFVPGLNPTDPGNHGAVAKVIVNNRNGDVKEMLYDSGNRMVVRREYTGRAADPNALTDLDANPPVNPPINPLRPGDPTAFETVMAWNADSMPTQITYPNGNIIEYEYDSLNPDPRAHGNRLVERRRPGSHTPPGDQPLTEEFFEYEPGFGGCCGGNFVIRHTDARGNDTLFDYDANGNLIHVQHRVPTAVEDYEYNAYGQMTARVWPDNGNGQRRRDEFTYYTSADGPQYGYAKERIVDAGGGNLTSTYEYNAVGQLTRLTNPRGFDTLYVVGQRDWTVQEISPEITPGRSFRTTVDTFYDADGNVIRADIENYDDQGVLQANTHFTTVYEFDLLNNLVRMCEEAGSYDVPAGQYTCAGLPDSEFVVTEYAYDANGNRILVREGEAVNGNQPNNVVITAYDERDLVFQEIRASGAPEQSTTQVDYDANQNRTRVSQGLEDNPRITQYVYDGYNRVVSKTDPMGNVETYQYDPNDNRVSERTDGELIDVPGSAGNVRLYEKSTVFDAMDRVITEDVEFFDPVTQTPILDGHAITTTEWTDNSQVLRVTDDNGHQTATLYDSINRPLVVTDAEGNTATYAYDANSNVISLTETATSDLGQPDEIYYSNYTYDGLDRRIRTENNIGSTTRHGYDSRGNETLTIDTGSYESRYTYDGLDRRIEIVHDMDGDGADPADADDIVVTHVWDDSSRLIQQIDDNSNTTTYSYDPLNRLISTTYADGSAEMRGYDVHDNPILVTDANGSTTDTVYDLLDRTGHKAITPGPGVAPTTTFENYQYDGLSRLVHAQDDLSIVTRNHDSLSAVIAETLNGQTTTSVYDGVGNRLQCTYPGGRIITCTYDGLRRLATIADTAGTIATFAFVGHRVERCDLGNGTRTEYTYDGIVGVPNPPNDYGAKQIIRKQHTRISDGMVIDDRTFTWDHSHNKTQRKDVRTGGPELTHNYSYDPLDRLIRTIVNDSGGVRRDQTYNLDGVHNRTAVSGDPDGGTYATNTVNEYLTTPFDERQYDANGNLTQYGGGIIGDTDCDGDVDFDDINPFVLALSGEAAYLAQYPDCHWLNADCDSNGTVNFDDINPFVALIGAPPTYRPQFAVEHDYRNRMVAHTDLPSGKLTTYSYDPLGRRIETITDVGGTPANIRYFYVGWQVIEEQDAAGQTQATYVYGTYIDEMLNMQRDTDGNGTPEDYYYHADDLYNVVAITSATGNVVERYEYGDCGKPLDPSALTPVGTPSTIGNPYGFTGRRYDEETGWYHYRTRYLDPSAGRFTTRDTIGVWGDESSVGNGYTYAANNPWAWLDPLGLAATPAGTYKIPKEVRKALDKAWKDSFNKNGTVQEKGGTIVKDKNGKTKTTNPVTGDGGSVSNDTSTKDGETLVGTYHTHPYSKKEGSHQGVGFSAADILYLLQGTNGAVMIVEAGTCTFVLKIYDKKKAEKCKKDGKNVKKRWNDAYKKAKGTFQQKVETAVKSALDDCGLAFYKGCGKKKDNPELVHPKK